jgi:hypothetical protein
MKPRAKTKPQPVHQCEIPLGALRPTSWPAKLDSKAILRGMIAHCARYCCEARSAGDAAFESGYYQAFLIGTRLSMQLNGLEIPQEVRQP